MSLPKTIMFYDGGCPLCSREIKHYRRLDSAGRIDWIDISRDASLLQAMGVTLETAMARLQVLHRDGWLATGAYAFAVVWSELPYYRWLARLVYGLGPAAAAGAPVWPIRPLAVPTPLSGGRLRRTGGGG